MAYVQLLNGATAPNGIPTAVKATGTITAVAVASLVDGETFTVGDARGKSCVFVLDVDGTYTAAAGRWRVNVSALTSSTDVATAIAAAVNASPIEVTATSSGATVSLTQSWPGTEGNMTILDSVADVGFVVSGFSSGTLSGFDLGSMKYGRAEHNEGDGTVIVTSTAGSGEMRALLRLWGYSTLTKAWTPIGKGTSSNKGELNDGVALTETSADAINHAEVVPGVSAFDRVYLEVEALDGVSIAISAFLASRRAP